MKKMLAVLCLSAFAAILCSQSAYAGEMDILIKKLVEKGILTQKEAQQIKAEVKEEAMQENAEARPCESPAWTQKIKLKNDLRLRHEWKRRKAANDRHRGRIRLRVGAEAEVNDKVKAGLRVASGGADPRSTNESFQNLFDSGDIRMDLAYASYAPFSWLELVGGKFERKPYLWQTTDILWDSDVNPEGISATFSRSAHDKASLFFNIGFWVLDESSGDGSDPFLVVFQPGFKYDFGGDISLKAAVAYQDFHNVKGAVLDNSAGTNTLSNGTLLYDYNIVNPSIELGIKNPGIPLVNLNYMAFFGDYSYNDDPNDNNEAYAFGIKIGDAKVKDPKQWQLKYLARRLEADAFIDALPDSDMWDGDTGYKGHEVVFEYGLAKNTNLGVDFYYTENISGDHQSEAVLQTDLNFKF